MKHVLRRLARLPEHAAALGGWLVLPVALLLCLQWPLRDWIQAYSREANDLAQWLFALYTAIAVSSATRVRAHLAADVFARRYAPATRERIYRGGLVAILVPWSLFVLVAGARQVWDSVMQLEGFPDTYNPGYFLVKLALWLLSLLVLLQSLRSALTRDAEAAQ